MILLWFEIDSIVSKHEKMILHLFEINSIAFPAAAFKIRHKSLHFRWHTNCYRWSLKWLANNIQMQSIKASHDDVWHTVISTTPKDCHTVIFFNPQSVTTQSYIQPPWLPHSHTSNPQRSPHSHTSNPHGCHTLPTPPGLPHRCDFTLDVSQVLLTLFTPRFDFLMGNNRVLTENAN